MRWLILLLLAAPLAAVEIHGDDADTLRFARLALLQKDVREHLGLEVGKILDLDDAWLGRGDFRGTGNPECLAMLRKGERMAAALFSAKDAKPLAQRLWKRDTFGKPFVRVQLGRARVALHDTRTETLDWGKRTHTDLTLFGMHGDALIEQLVITECSSAESTDTRYRCTESAQWRDAGQLLVCEVNLAETLDREPVGQAAQRRDTFRLNAAGRFVREAAKPDDIDAAARLATARRLERAAMPDVALAVAREAELRAANAGIKASDARRLDARALIVRLEARLQDATVSR